MILPNKLFTYEESTLGKFAQVLRQLKRKPYDVKDLYEVNHNLFLDVSEFTETLSCLYALNKITLDEERGVITYVEDDTVQ